MLFLFILILITIIQWSPETGESSKCIFFASICYFYVFLNLLLDDFTYICCNKDECVYTWICSREIWMSVRLFARYIASFSPARWRISYPSFYYCDICDLWWRLMRVSRGCVSRSSLNWQLTVAKWWILPLLTNNGGRKDRYWDLPLVIGQIRHGWRLIILLRSLVGGVEWFNLFQEAV